MLLQLPLSGFS